MSASRFAMSWIHFALTALFGLHCVQSYNVVLPQKSLVVPINKPNGLIKPHLPMPYQMYYSLDDSEWKPTVGSERLKPFKLGDPYANSWLIKLLSNTELLEKSYYQPDLTDMIKQNYQQPPHLNLEGKRYKNFFHNNLRAQPMSPYEVPSSFPSPSQAPFDPNAPQLFESSFQQHESKNQDQANQPIEEEDWDW